MALSSSTKSISFLCQRMMLITFGIAILTMLTSFTIRPNHYLPQTNDDHKTNDKSLLKINILPSQKKYPNTNYIKHPNFTKCEDSILGWSWAKKSFFSKKVTMCSPPSSSLINDKWIDEGWSLLECYYGSYDRYDGKLQFCRGQNVYAFVVKDHKKHFKLNYKYKCEINSNEWNKRIKKSSNSNGSGKWGDRFHPFQSDLTVIPPSNDNNTKITYLKMKYIDNNIWNIGRGNCQHTPFGMGNVWHCFSDILMKYTAQKIFNHTQNESRIVLTEGYEHINTKDDVVYKLLNSIFKYIELEPPSFNYNKSFYPEINKEFLIKEAIYDATPWNSLSWSHQHKQCNDAKHQRSPILWEFRDHFVDYWDSMKEIIDNDWIQSIVMNKNYEIYANGTILNTSFTANNDSSNYTYNDTINRLKYMITIENKTVLYIASRWLINNATGKKFCNHRCIWNFDELKVNIIDTFNGNNMIIIVGNPAWLSFPTQYNLFRNIDILFGMHGAIFAWSMIMYPGQMMFEIVPPNWWDSLHWSRMLNITYKMFECRFCCNACNGQQSNKNTLKIDKVMKEFTNFIQANKQT